MSRTKLLRLLTPPLLFGSLIGLVFSPRSNWGVAPPARIWVHREIPSNHAYFGALESKALQPGAYLVLRGWVGAGSAGTRVEKLELAIDGKSMDQVTEFRLRPDLAAAFNRPDLQMSSWESIISTEKLNSGVHVLSVRAFGSDGSSELVITEELTIRQ
jgi:hypothetical protein